VSREHKRFIIIIIKKNKLKKSLTILFLCLLISLSTKAQNELAETQNPKIGLVLSGGGAKGLAHIGALKTIDSLGVKIDYVAALVWEP
jgi:NTE family protein